MKALEFLKMLNFNKPGLLSMFFISTFMGSINVNATLIYVNISNTSSIQNGKSWQTAFSSLQDALNKAAATPGKDVIWVATGVYVPSKIYSPNGIIGGASRLNTPFLRTFNLPDQVSIYGGFAGIEKELNERNPLSFPTTLSGAASGGDVWHVVTLGNDINQTGVTAKLDGLVITNGNASGPAGQNILFAPFLYDHSLGGGIYSIFGSNLEVINVSFSNNIATNAGGINTNGDGGALASVSSNLCVKDSRFNQNSSFTEGGALEVFNQHETSPHQAIIENCDFTNNTTGLFGGALVGEGILPHEQSFIEINNCFF